MKKLIKNGYELIMDDDVYEFLKDKNIEFYKRRGGVYPILSLHRMFFNTQQGKVVDHINRNPQDFRRDNLRHISIAENNRNKASKGLSKYNGVSYLKRDKLFKAVIHYQNKPVWLGRYINEIDAARAYDIASLQLFPNLKITNFPLSNYTNIDIKEEFIKVINKNVVNNTSGFRGVCIDKRHPDLGHRRFYAYYKEPLSKKTKYLGSFDTALEAAIYRDEYAREHNCRESRLNFKSNEYFSQWIESN